MTCADVLDVVDALASGDFEAGAEVRRHLETCARCAAALATARRIEVMIAARPAPPAPAPAPPRVVEAPRRGEPEVRRPPPSARFEPEPEPVREREREREPAREAGGSPETASRVLAVEAGGFLVRRTLEYGGVGPMSGSLHGLDARGIAGPWLGAELSPLAGSRSALRGLGLYGRWRTSIGFTVEAPGAARDARYTSFEAGAAWRTPPLGAARFALAPSVAWRGLSLTVAPSIPGLPDARLSGVRAGLGVELRLGRVAISGRAGWVRWLEARELVKGTPAFFPGGSAEALDAEAGVGVALGGRFSLRLIGEYERTRYALDPDSTGTYAAKRADDRYVGGRAVGRVEL
ncbi:MAG TPA: hypothetical protein VLT47_02370 [Anaeromyxobacteraceae bacterium]|nr:hypothetical protein [Anaeromyxobacteraceae bacterium]